MKNLKKLVTMSICCFITVSAFGCSMKAADKKEEKTTVFTKTNEKLPKQYVKIALLLDTSNSMDGLINQAKAQLWDIVNEFTHARCGNENRPLLKIALYEYGNDNLASREGYIRQVINFSGDLDEISEKLFSLTTNGGEEFCGQVIHTSLGQLDWGKNADDLKMIFIAGNEPFTQGKLNYREATSLAKEKDVVVNTIFCGNYEQGIATNWKDGAVLTGGDYMAIDHNKQIVHVTTPYDEVIIKLNSQLNKTYIGYGYLGTSKMSAQAEQDANAYELNEVVALKRAKSKSSRLYSNSSWDLVDALEGMTLGVEIEREALPEILKDKSDTEIKKYVETKKLERQKIQKEIQELSAKREAYIAKNQKDEKGELENAMLNAIKKQAERKNYVWE